MRTRRRAGSRRGGAGANRPPRRPLDPAIGARGRRQDTQPDRRRHGFRSALAESGGEARTHVCGCPVRRPVVWRLGGHLPDGPTLLLGRASNELQIRLRVTKPGTSPVRFMWNQHVAPAIERGSRIHLPASELGVVGEAQRPQRRAWLRLGHRRSGERERGAPRGRRAARHRDRSGRELGTRPQRSGRPGSARWIEATLMATLWVAL